MKGKLRLLLTSLAVALYVALCGNASALEVGDIAPDFALTSSQGGEVRLSDFRGKSMVLIEFYHADWGPSCVANLERRRDDYDRFSELGVQVLAISLNHSYSQAALASSLRLPYPLLSDAPHGRTVTAYGVGYLEGDAGRLFARPSFFLVDRQGIIRGYWGQRPMNADEILAPDPLVSSEPMLEMARSVSASE